MNQRVAADIPELLAGTECVDAQRGNNLIGRSFAHKRYTLYNIVTVNIGPGLEFQFLGSYGRGLGIGAGYTVMLVIYGTVA